METLAKQKGRLFARIRSRIDRMSRTKKRLWFVGLVLTPLIVWLLIYMLIPIVTVIMYSFTNAHMAYPDYEFVGLYQYQKMFSDAMFLTSIKNTVVAVIVIVPVTVVLSTLTAAGLNALSNRFRQLYTFIYFVPSIISVTAICLVWRWLYNPNYGLFNAILNAFGLPLQGFLQSGDQALLCICAIHIWSHFGYYAVIVLANMRGIDRSLYESADIAGANSVQKFMSITVPMLKNTFLFVMIMATTSAFMLYGPVQILTEGRGTPGSSTMVLLLYAMNKGIKQSNIAYGSGISLVLMIIILLFSLIQWVLTRERTKKLPVIRQPKSKKGE